MNILSLDLHVKIMVWNLLLIHPMTQKLPLQNLVGEVLLREAVTPNPWIIMAWEFIICRKVFAQI